MSLPKRKPNRIPGYDYSQDGYYYITICTVNRKPILSRIEVRDAAHGVPKIRLTTAGETVNQYLLSIDHVYDNVRIDKYVIMPNHIHCIIAIRGDGMPWAASPTITVPKIINSFKTLTSKLYGQTLWQRSYYDRIIRGEQEYLEVWKYIDSNPQKWQEDRYYGDSQ